MRRAGAGLLTTLALCLAADQTQPGPGNAAAAQVARGSPAVQAAKNELLKYASELKNPTIRAATLDALQPSTCVAHRAGLTEVKKQSILDSLIAAGLADRTADAMAGVFPPVLNEAFPCPKLPQPFESAPGSNFGGHHSYPGGLSIHERFNLLSSLNFARLYDSVGGHDSYFNRDLLIAAPIWHDWAKSIVFQWNADGTEFSEFNFGGSAQVDTKTGAHHILSLAEAMKRGLPAELIITQASAHAAPVLGNQKKVENWIRAAAFIAQVDPVARGYLNLTFRSEYSIHNLSDSDFVLSIPAVSQAEALLKQLAGEFGYTSNDGATYNVRFRNPVLSHLTAERLLFMRQKSGIAAIRLELQRLRTAKII